MNFSKRANRLETFAFQKYALVLDSAAAPHIPTRNAGPLAPVIDGVEGAFTRLASVDPASVKLLGNVPPQPPPGGVLRHKGWRCTKIDLPTLQGKQDTQIIAPAEVEIE